MKHEILIYNKTHEKISKEFIESVILRTFDFLKLKQPMELAVLIVSAKEISKLNKIWRKKNYTPDELSFGLNSRKSTVFAKGNVNVISLGEIIISSEKIRDKKYLTRILIHSLLHLLGYHHEKSIAEAKKMERLEVKIFSAIGWSAEGGKHLNI